MIWKDSFFALSYLLAFSIIIRYQLLEKLKPSIITKLLTILILLYGTAIKYQAIYCIPLALFWYLRVFFKLSNMKNILITIILSVGVNYAIDFANKYIANDFNDDTKYGWQEIMLNDLLYISVRKDEVLLPSYIKDNQNFDFTWLKENYYHGMILLIRHKEGSAFSIATSVENQNELYQCWKAAIVKYPFSYLRGRVNFIGKIFRTKDFNQQETLPNNPILKDTYNAALLDNSVKEGVYAYTKYFAFITPLKFYVPFILLYCFLGVRSYLRHNSTGGYICMMLSLYSLFFILIMTFKTVFFDFRYLFICHVMFHFSHPFAWRAIKDLQAKS